MRVMILETILACFVAVTLLAKRRGSRRRYRKYIKGSIEEDMSLGTLAAKTLVAQAFADVVTEKTFISSIVASWTLADFTPTDNVGPIMVGIAHSDYTAAEIEAWVEQVTSWDEGDLVSQEIARRKIRRVGVFSNTIVGGAGITALNDGKPIRTKCKWVLTTGNNIDVWAYNMGSAAVVTTVPSVHIGGYANLWPM